MIVLGPIILIIMAIALFIIGMALAWERVTKVRKIREIEDELLVFIHRADYEGQLFPDLPKLLYEQNLSIRYDYKNKYWELSYKNYLLTREKKLSNIYWEIQ